MYNVNIMARSDPLNYKEFWVTIILKPVILFRRRIVIYKQGN